MIRKVIEEAIAQALTVLGAPSARFVLERPGDMAHGDYATNAALAASKLLGKSPREVAEALKEALDGEIAVVEKIEVAGPGFINFYLTHEALMSVVIEAATKDSWGANAVYTGKMVMVEYTDPNPFKEFHIGHLMSNAIGEAIARTLENAGAMVIRANYQGDVGLHVAKAIWGYMKQEENLQRNNPKASEKLDQSLIQHISWGLAYQYGSEWFDDDENAKAEIQAINERVYKKNDPKVDELYKNGRNHSLEAFESIYTILGTKFNKYFFESETTPHGLELVKKYTGPVFEESDGAVVYKGEKVGLHTRVFINSKGLPTYEAKDLGLLKLKKETAAFNQSVTVTASEQTEYFKVMLAAAKEIPEVAEVANNTTHITHGMMRFADGKMSSRKGNVITGESLLADLAETAKEKMGERELADPAKVAEQIAVGAIKFTVLRQGSGKDIVFDPEKSLSLEGDSGPYLQYAHTRALSLIAAAEAAGIVAENSTPESGEDMHQTSMHPRAVLERTLLHFPDAVMRATAELEPHYITTHLIELAGAFNSWYAAERLIGGENPAYGLMLAKATERTLARGLHLLGIPAPEKM